MGTYDVSILHDPGDRKRTEHSTKSGNNYHAFYHEVRQYRSHCRRKWFYVPIRSRIISTEEPEVEETEETAGLEL